MTTMIVAGQEVVIPSRPGIQEEVCGICERAVSEIEELTTPNPPVADVPLGGPGSESVLVCIPCLELCALIAPPPEKAVASLPIIRHYTGNRWCAGTALDDGRQHIATIWASKLREPSRIPGVRNCGDCAIAVALDVTSA